MALEGRGQEFFREDIARPSEGDHVAVQEHGMVEIGGHTGEVMGYPPTGNTIKYLGIHTHTIKDGKIVESWVLEDSLFLFKQLGMELKPKEGEAAEASTHEGQEGQEHERGEHAGEGEEAGPRISKDGTHDEVRKGVRLILSFDNESSSFIGTVENVTEKTISRVRVEVHLSNGNELGPTEPIDLAPGKKVEVKLSAEGQSFNWWKAHAEASEY